MSKHKIDVAWSSFRRTKSGGVVAGVLARIFHNKCAYCEQEAARDIEHYYPKSRYPERMFTWDNFLWCCKNCNTEKLAAFPLDTSGQVILLNPTRDEPLDYLAWDDLSGRIIPHPDPIRGLRTTRTRDLLGLDQSALAEERRNKLRNVLYLLSHVLTETPVHMDTIERLREELSPHRPWLGIVRQLFCRPAPKYLQLIRAVREKLPELNTWLKPWFHSPRQVVSGHETVP